MSNARERIQQALENTREWYTQKELMTTLRVCSSECSIILRSLIADGIAQAMTPPPGRAHGCKRIYAAAGVPALLGAEALAPDAQSNLRRLPKKLKGFRAEARKRQLAKNRKLTPMLGKAGQRIALTDKRYAAITTPPRWALASDGAMILLDSGLEISKPAARALVEFVRALDAGAA